MRRNFLNFGNTKIDKPIFRVFSIDRLIQVFSEKELTLVKPRKWDDPFENYLLNCTGEFEAGQYIFSNSRERFFGQCWTSTRESDALWRIYAPNKDGVRVTSTSKKLVTALCTATNDNDSFVGKVRYYKTDALTAILNNVELIKHLKNDSSNVDLAKTLLMKRLPFQHENEIRLLHVTQTNSEDDFFKFQIDPFSLLDEIVFDPRMDYSIFSKWKLALKKMGYNRKIVKSNLYKIPDLKISLPFND
jgi:hypothetical protein